MGRLVPTPIIDSLGRATTVHRRPAGEKQARQRSALASAAPSMSAPRAPEASPVLKLKVKVVRRCSREVALGARMDLEGSAGDSAVLAARAQRLLGQSVEVAQADAYAFLRLGIDLQGAALLTALGAAPEAVARTHEIARVPAAEDDTFARRGGRDTSIARVADAMEKAGVPAAKAEKALMHGLQNQHYWASLLEIDQLVALFSRWKYASAADAHGSSHGGTAKDELIDCFVQGKLPFDMADRPIQQLVGVARELRRTEALVEPQTADLRETMRKDPDLVHDICRKLAGDEYEREYGMSGVRYVLGLVRDHGREVLDLRVPLLAAQCGLGGARYVERIAEVAKENGADHHWTVGMRAQQLAEGVRLANDDALRMQDAGLSPEEAYEALAVHGLRPDRAITVHESGIRGALSDGAL